MAPGDAERLGGYEFRFQGTEHLQGPNYQGERGIFEVYRDGRLYTRLHPEKRSYTVAGSVMTEAAIDPGLFRDLYVAMGERLEGDAWAVRIQYKPFVRWIWLGGIFMAVGGLLAAMDKRYRRMARREMATQQARAEAAAV